MNTIRFDQSRPMDIIPVGRIAIDFNPQEIHCPISESVTFKKYIGGSPANIAVGMARLGKKVGFIGKISDDQFGDFAEWYFKKEGIDVSHITRCTGGEKLGLAFTEIKSPTESSLVMYRQDAADLKLDPADVDEEYIRQSKSVLISGTALCQSPSREAALKVLELAKKTNTIVIFDIDWRAYTWKSMDEVALYYSYVGKQSDIIMGSREEFDLMQRLIAPQGEDDAAIAKRFLDYGNQIIVIKHGKEGSTAYTKDGLNYSIKPFPVTLHKSFGGGDGYASAFLYGLMEGWEIIDALEFGSAEAAMLVAAPSCSDSMPSAEAVTAFIKEEKEKYGEMIARV